MTTLLTPDAIHAMPEPVVAMLKPETIALVERVTGRPITQDTPSYDGVSLIGLLFDLTSFGQVNEQTVAASIAVLTDAGYVAPAGCGPREALAALDLGCGMDGDWNTTNYNRRVAYACAVAFAADEPDVALTVLDGQGAGIGWAITRENLEAKIAVMPANF